MFCVSYREGRTKATAKPGTNSIRFNLLISKMNCEFLEIFEVLLVTHDYYLTLIEADIGAFHRDDFKEESKVTRKSYQITG